MRNEDSVEPIDLNLLQALTDLSGDWVAGSRTDADAKGLFRVFEAQVVSRHLDFQARIMRAEGTGFYTIGSSGHEANAFIADALRPTDPAFLHYRSGAFYQARASQVSGIDGISDVLLSLSAAASEPISGGRHKVFGRTELSIIPGTSTIASHLPRAMGTAFAIERAPNIGLKTVWSDDGIVVCSFGDASANHSTALGAINAVCHTVFQGLSMPILFLCEDNGIGISVPTPENWIEASYSRRPELKYFRADSTDPVQVMRAANDAVNHVRLTRKPAFFHLKCVRFLAHAGSDAEVSYRAPRDMQADFACDPLIATARVLVETGQYSANDLLAVYEDSRMAVQSRAHIASSERKLQSADEIMAPLAPRSPEAVRTSASSSVAADLRSAAFDGKLPESEGPLTLSASINRALIDGLLKDDGMLLFGEDVGRKGGVYGVTTRLQRRFGRKRVFDTLLDEQSILGLALGCSISGLLPVAEIQYLAYLHNAIDQIRGEAATQQFFSNGSYRNGMVIRIAGLAYQKGFGGHFHNDNSLAALLDIPGIVVAVPSRGADAAAMLRTSLAAARTDGTVTAFVEPIALYHSRDLIHPGDEGMLDNYLPPESWGANHIAIGSARTYPSKWPREDLSIFTFGNGVGMALRVAGRLSAQGHGITVVDLRWLNPLPVDDILRQAKRTNNVLIVDETRARGGVSESVISTLVDGGYRGNMARVASLNSFIPLADAANLVLLDEQSIEDAARRMLIAVPPQP